MVVKCLNVNDYLQVFHGRLCEHFTHHDAEVSVRVPDSLQVYVPFLQERVHLT